MTELGELLSGGELDVSTYVFGCNVHAEAMLAGMLRGLRVIYDDLCAGSEAATMAAMAAFEAAGTASSTGNNTADVTTARAEPGGRASAGHG